MTFSQHSLPQQWRQNILCLLLLLLFPSLSLKVSAFSSLALGQQQYTSRSGTTALYSEEPSTFREAEVLGLKLMQGGNYEQALTVFQKGLKLPGTKFDIIRTKRISGPSPVGGSFGGLESQSVQSLDEFELQAAHYNMACAYAQLGSVAEAIRSLEIALENGFDNYATIVGDPDLVPIQSDPEFSKLMKKCKGSDDRGFNPFMLFGKS